MSTITRCGAAAVALGLGLGLPTAAAFADDITPPSSATPVVGMAYDPDSTNLWLAGPEADSGTIVAARSGEEVTFGGDPVSVQALAWSSNHLWIGDIGDPSASREFVVVFRLEQMEGRSSYRAYDFEYEDGPRDAQAMMISGRGRIYIVTAGEDPGIYRAELNPSRESMNTLTRVTDAPEGVTDGAFLTDGSTMVLRTATGLEYVDAFTWEPMVTDTIVGAPEGESVAVGADDQVFVGGNPGIREVAVPASDTTTTVSPGPEASATQTTSPSASPSVSASASAADETPDSDGSAPATSGTVIALVLAGVVALAAGAVTFFLKN